MILKPMFNRTLIILVILIYGMGSSGASQLPDPDPGEKWSEFGSEKLDDQMIVKFGGSRGTYAYVLYRNKIVWKSPLIYGASSFGSYHTEDINGNNLKDYFTVSGCTPEFCDDLWVIIILDNAQKFYLIHYESYHRGMSFPDAPFLADNLPKNKPTLSISEAVPQGIMDKIAPYLLQNAGKIFAPPLQKLLAGKKYEIMQNEAKARERLDQFYQIAMGYYKKKKYFEAKQTLSYFFTRHDLLHIDPENKDAKYTEILNNYAFFVWKEYLETVKSYEDIYKTGQDIVPGITNAPVHSGTEAKSSLIYQGKRLLELVLKRDPQRAVAFLNMADFLMAEGGEKQEELANTYYQKHQELLAKEKKNKVK